MRSPLLEHMTLAPEVQDPSVPKDIRSLFQLLGEINDLREPRMEHDPVGEVPLPPAVQILAGYQDGSVDSWDLNMNIQRGTAREVSGKLRPAKGDARRFVDAEAKKKLAQVSDAQKAKAVYDRVDVDRIYPLLEEQAVSMMKETDRMYYALFRKCLIQYQKDRTASIQWDRSLKRFILRINKKFMVYMTVMNLMNGFPKSTMSSLGDVYRSSSPNQTSAKVLASTLMYVLLHEMGHIFFQHLGKRGGLYTEFSPYEVNVYGDILINLTLTKMMSGKVDRNLVPNVGLGKDQVLKGQTKNARESIQKFLNMTRDDVVYDFDAQALAFEFREEPASLLVIYSPGAFVEVGSSTASLMKFYKHATAALELNKPPKVIESDEKYVPPTVVSTPVEPGQVVMVKATGEVAVVVRAENPVPNPEVEGDFDQVIEIVKKSELPEEIRDQIDAAVEAAGNPDLAEV